MLHHRNLGWRRDQLCRRPCRAGVVAILAHSQDWDGTACGRKSVPAAQRTVSALLGKQPSAVTLVCAGYLRRRAAQRQQADADVAALARERPQLLRVDGAAEVASSAAELQQAGCTAAQVAAMAWERPQLLLTWRPWLESGLSCHAASPAKVAEAWAVVQQDLGLTAQQAGSCAALHKS